MRKFALLLNSFLFGLTVFLWFYVFLAKPFGDLNDLGILMFITPFLLFSLFNLIAIYTCNQIYKGYNTIQTLAVVSNFIIFIFISVFWSEPFNPLKDVIYVLVVVGIISVLPFLNLFLLYKCK